MEKIDTHLKKYIKELTEKGIREDGRKPDEFRKISIEANPLSQANGSARIKIGETEVLAGVKIGMGTPYPDSPKSGTLIVSFELSPISSKKFDPGPPREDAIELARILDRAVRESQTIDFDKLCVEEKEKVWMVFIDIYPLNNDGNLLDAALLAANVALKKAVLPKYDKKEEIVNHRELTNKKLPLKEEAVLCTFTKVGNTLLVDPTEREEQIMCSRISIGLNSNGDICAMQKGGEGTLSQKEILDAVEKTKKISTKLRKELSKAYK